LRGEDRKREKGREGDRKGREGGEKKGNEWVGRKETSRNKFLAMEYGNRLSYRSGCLIHNGI